MVLNKTNKIALFRFEASAQIGGGHAIRSTVLAKYLQDKGWQILLLTSAQTYHFIPALQQFERIDITQFQQQPFTHDLLVIDDYNWDASTERFYRPFAKKILVIDDLANRSHDCDFLLDQTFGRKAQDYHGLVPRDCLCLVGTQYTLLRPEFASLRPQALEKRRQTTQINNILISFGASVSIEYVLCALQILKDKQFKGDIAIVQGFEPFNEDCRRQCEHFFAQQIHFYHNANIAQLMRDADFGIGAAGGSVWERCCLALPCAVTKIASNQDMIFQTLIEHQLAIDLNQFSLESLHQVDYVALSRLVDGFGCNRVYLAITQENRLHFRDIIASDKELIYQWQQKKDLRKYFIYPSIPTWDEHNRWFDNRITLTQSPYWMVLVDDVPCGTISLTYDNAKSCFELGWYIIPEYQGRGLGTQAVAQAMETVWPIPIKAFVKTENEASHRSLQKAGLMRVDENNYRSQHVY